MPFPHLTGLQPIQCQVTPPICITARRRPSLSVSHSSSGAAVIIIHRTANRAYVVISLLLRLLTQTTSRNDGELIVVDWRQEWRQYHIFVAAVWRSHESCIQGYLHHHWNSRCSWQLVCHHHLRIVHQDHCQGISSLKHRNRTILTCITSQSEFWTVPETGCNSARQDAIARDPAVEHNRLQWR